jgi:hypothetical protein
LVFSSYFDRVPATGSSAMLAAMLLRRANLAGGGDGPKVLPLK